MYMWNKQQTNTEGKICDRQIHSKRDQILVTRVWSGKRYNGYK